MNFLITTLIASLCLYGIHAYALTHFLYFHVEWFDSVVHVLGGFTLGLLVLIPRIEKSITHRAVYTSILGAFLFSLIWELFEYKIGMTFVSPKYFDRYVYDTITDVVFGTLGGFCAGCTALIVIVKK